MRFRRWLCIVAFVAAGCDGRSVVPVSGRVTLDGAPFENAIVLFQPVGDRHNPGTGSSGRTDADGRFTLRQIQPDRPGAWPGSHRVVITLAPVANRLESQPGFAIRFKAHPATFNVPPEGTAEANFTVTVDKSR